MGLPCHRFTHHPVWLWREPGPQQLCPTEPGLLLLKGQNPISIVSSSLRASGGPRWGGAFTPIVAEGGSRGVLLDTP